MTDLNIEALKKDINYNQYLTGIDILQRIMDLAHKQWEKDWDWKDVTNNIRFKYGDFAQFIVLACKLHQQVLNGGFSQYFENGYASNSYGIKCEINRSHDLHHTILSYFNKFKLQKILPEMESILKNFEVILSGREGMLTETEYDWLNTLDNRYYNIDNKWLEGLSLHVKCWLESGKNPHEQ
jgi:hypothetical protein